MCQAFENEQRLSINGFPVLPTKGSTPCTSTLNVPAAIFNFQGHRLLLPVRRCVQDPVHLTKKLVNPLCNEAKDLRMGGVRVSTTWLRELLSDRNFAITFEERFKLRVLDLLRPDRQDFRAAQRLLDPAVYAYLQQLYASDCLEAKDNKELFVLIGYLKFARKAMDSYLNPELDPCARIKAASYACFFAEAWEAHLRKVSNKRSEAASHFISKNAAAGLRINLEFLFVWCYVLTTLPKDIREQICFAPWLFGSQPCEELFRLLRQMPGHENFDIYELLKRLNLLQATSLIKAEGIFQYPESRKAWNFDEICKISSSFPPTVTPDALREAALSGCKEAIEDVAALCGVKLDKGERLGETASTLYNEEDLCSDDDEEERIDLITEPV